jgi:uncharacterized membrane protein
MSQPNILSKNRIESIDILRGIVMVIMALDHVRDFFHETAFTEDPLNIETTTPILFFTRLITHFCAPIFVFLSGTSIFLQSLRKSKAELTKFLITRGLWLILVEVCIISLALTFDYKYGIIFLQVIFVIGLSMIILAFLIHLPFKIIFTIGLLIVIGHNLLDIVENAPGFKTNFWWDLSHRARYSIYPIAEGHNLVILYAFLPWLGLMILGYCFGIFFTEKYTINQRAKILTKIGASVIAFFIIVRTINIYGDVPWPSQKNAFDTFLAFIRVNKYPPSLLFMCFTIGIAILVLSILEKSKNTITNFFKTFGRVAFFYYIIHWFTLRAIVLIYFYANGHDEAFAIDLYKNIPFKYIVPADGIGLPYVYAIWIFIIAVLYPICKWYDKYKTNHPEKWWLSYL